MTSYWMLASDKDVHYCCTPLGSLTVSFGGWNFETRSAWWGFEFQWLKNKQREEGGYVFLKSARWIFARKSHLQFVDRRPWQR